MGEIRVKSENLFDVTTVTNVYLDVQGVEHSSEVSRTSDYIPVTANTLYTLGMTGGSSSLNLTAYCFYDSNKEFLSSGTYQPSTIGNIVSITTPNNCAYFRFTYNYLRNLVEFVSGVYNTFPPYFLNLSSHEKTSTGWKDIPTHTMTATGWQGELTSQSPLEFRATGQSLLDWRVEGRTSKNLFDKKDNIPNAVLDAGEIVTAGELGGFLIFAKVEAGKTYSFRTSDYVRLSLRSVCTIEKPTIGTSYVIDGENTHINHGESRGFIRTIPNKANWLVIQIRDAANLDNNNILIEGSYSYSEFPPYEPYGGVGDWDETEQKYVIPVNVNGTTTNLYTDAQLMDGDSLVYTTDQTTIPITQGDNTLTVETAVQPSKVFVKFEG